MRMGSRAVLPSLEEPEKIAVAFQVAATVLLARESGESPVARQEDRVRVLLPSRVGKSLSIHRQMQNFGTYLRAGDDGADMQDFFSHRGDEMIRVREGAILLCLEKENHVLKAGDTISFNAAPVTPAV